MVVEPEAPAWPRLVPLDRVDAAAGQIRLRCTLAKFDKLEPAEQMQFLPGSSGDRDYNPDQMLSWAYYDLGSGPGMAGNMVNVSQAVTYHSVPLG